MAIPVCLAAIRATVVGSDSPAEAKIFSHQCIHMNRINSTANYGWCRQIYGLVPADTVSAVNMVVTGKQE